VRVIQVQGAPHAAPRSPAYETPARFLDEVVVERGRRAPDAAERRQARADLDAAIGALEAARSGVLSAMFAGIDSPASAAGAIVTIDALIARARRWAPAPVAAWERTEPRVAARRVAVSAPIEPEQAALPLTRREMDVLDGLGRGLAPAALADELGISLETCRAYIKSLRRKLHAKTQLEAVVIAGRMGLFPARR
jgi:DNA-binding NarL/FixJ family response regulator